MASNPPISELRNIIEEIGRRAAQPLQVPLPAPVVTADVLGPALQRTQDAVQAASGGPRSQRAARKLLGRLTGSHRPVDEAMLESLLGLNHVVGILAAAVQSARVELAEAQAREAVRRGNELVELDQLQQSLARQDEQIEALVELAEQLRSRVTAIDRRMPSAEEGTWDAVYRGFEDRFRGERDEITLRLKPYLDTMYPAVRDGGTIVDIGPGRGEWLQILRDAGWECYGVELDPVSVEELRSEGFHVVDDDGVHHLEGLAPASVAGVTAFHVIEHLGPASAFRMIQAAFDALTPGGIAIFETPNVSNVRVGASGFYRDPSHIRPVPADWLAYLLEHVGFTEVEVRYLHPLRPLHPVRPNDGGSDELNQLLDDVQWALDGPQDVAVIGTRPLA